MLGICMVPANESSNDDGKIIDLYLSQIANGDESALEDLYNRLRVNIFSYALSVLKNRQDAEDIMHDCFLQIWSAAPSYKSAGRPMAWIVTITRNLCLMKLRERKNMTESAVEDWDVFIESKDELSHEDRALITGCMNQLGDEERQVVVLHAVWGLKHREIADYFGLSLSTVLSKYRRAIKKLQITLKGE